MEEQINNHLTYYDGMEQIDSDLLEQTLSYRSVFQSTAYTKADVTRALTTDSLTVHDFGALLSPAALPYLERMAAKARQETARFFGNAVTMFTPLYLSNYCENHCVYCGFQCSNKIRRGRLEEDDIRRELETVAQTGLKEILLLTGESRGMSGVAYIGRAIQIACEYFSTVGIEVYPMNVAEYRHLRACGADFVSVYQETYDTDCYAQMHSSGPKRSFPYRFYAQERAVLGGMRGVAFGSLLGLSAHRADAFSAGVHAMLLQKKYPRTEISFSFPRLRPYQNSRGNKPVGVGERELLQVMLSYRLFMPFAGITISTRERQGFRDHVIGLCATKISAGVKVGVGGHDGEAKGDEQFEISDPRSVDEIRREITARGLQPVFTDYIRL